MYSEKNIFFNYKVQQEIGIYISNLIIAHDFADNKYSFKNNEEFVSR